MIILANEVTVISDLDPKQQRFVHLYLTGSYTNKEIAQLLDIHQNTLYNWLNNDKIIEVIREIQRVEHETIETQLKAMRTKAINTMMDLMDSPIDGVRYQASKDILDRAGHKSKQEIKVDKTVKSIEMQLNDLASELIEDAEFVEVD